MSDIHANAEALEAVLSDIEHQDVDKVVCLGDIIGYGPDPVACIDRIRGIACAVVRGNCEEAVVEKYIGSWCASGRQMIQWTKEQVSRGGLLSMLGMPTGSFRFLQRLPRLARDGSALYVHGSPRYPEGEYLMVRDFGKDSTSLGRAKEIFGSIDHLLFVGHSHTPFIVYEGEVARTEKEVRFLCSVDNSRKVIVNVGSVGQPRDHDNRACYVIEDGDTIEWRRIEYDYEKTIEKIESKMGHLDYHYAESSAARIRKGV